MNRIGAFPTPGPHPCGLAWDGTSLWYSDGETRRLSLLDPVTGAVRAEYPLPNVRAGLAFKGGALYQVGGEPPSLVRLAPPDYRPEPGRVLGDDASGIAGGGLVLYVLRQGRGVLQAQEWESGTTLAVWPGVADPGGLAVSGLRVVFAEAGAGVLWIRRPEAREATRWEVGGTPTGLAVGPGRLYVNDDAKREIQVFDWPTEASDEPWPVMQGLLPFTREWAASTRAEVADVLAAALYQPTAAELAACLDEYLAPHARLYVQLDAFGGVEGVLGLDARDPGLVEVSHIAVAPLARGRGVGRRMMARAAEALAPRTLWLSTDQDAVNFYRRLGMTVHSLGERCPGRERFLAVGRRP